MRLERIATIRPLAAALAALFAAAPAQALQFTVTDLGTLGGSASAAYGLNDAGQVAGSAKIGTGYDHAFVWQAGSGMHDLMQDAGALGGSVSYATGINAAGQAVGYVGNPSGDRFAFLWQPGGTMQYLGNLGGVSSTATAINSAGLVVGYSTTSNAVVDHAFLWQAGGGMKDLGTPSGYSSSAYGINDAGQVVGASASGGGAFLWQPNGGTPSLGTLGGTNSQAVGINNAGQVVGYANNSLGDPHAFLWQAGSGMQDLGTLGGRWSYGYAINGAGQVVGDAQITGSADFHAFLRGAAGGMVDVNTLLAADGGATVTDARAINTLGQIAGTATIGGQGHAVLLTPTGTLGWVGSHGGAFGDAGNWELGFAPNGLLDAIIAPAASQTVHADADATVRSLTVGSTSGGRPTLALQYGANLTASNGATVLATGTLTGDGKIIGNVANLGTLQANNLTITGAFSNQGLVTGSGWVNANLTNTASGQVRSGAGEYLHLVGSGHSNAGTLDMSGGGTQEYTGALTNASGGRILLKDAVLRLNDGLSNSGQVDVSFGTSDIFGPVTTNSGGKVILSGNSNTTFYDQLDIKSGGELRVSAGSAAVFFGQVLQRTGALFTGSGAKFYEGGLSVGASPGLGTDEGSVTFGGGNTYLAEIGGLTACTLECGTNDVLKNSSYDKYIVAGSLTFGGTLQLVSWDGYSGKVGDSFDLFDWGTTSGQFDTIDASGFQLAGGTKLDTSRLYVDGSISVAAVPEPETWAMLLVGLGLVGLSARRAGRRNPILHA